MITRVYETANLDTPRTQLLSNGAYSVMLTTAGSGYSICEGDAVTRWREDVTRDNWGAFIYLRDVRSGAVWSAGHQPVRRRPQSYHVAFSEEKADFLRIDSGIATRMEVVVSAEDNAEVRRISLTNLSSRTREITRKWCSTRPMLITHTRRSAISLSRRSSLPVRTPSSRTGDYVHPKTNRSGAFTSSLPKAIW
jgi:cellobiose phosphorylase